MAAAAGPASLASAGLQAYSQIESAKATKNADDAQSQRLQQAAAYGQVQAKETSATDNENLAIHLGNIDAIRAASRDDPTSPTGAAVRDRTSYLATRADTIKVNNILVQSNQDTADAAYMQQAGSFALTQGMIGAGVTLLNGGGKGFGGGSPGGTSGLDPSVAGFNQGGSAGAMY